MYFEKNYYLGLDIGTDSVGYAVTDQEYSLLKYKGESMWGTTMFEGGNDCAERRMHRTGRRRIDRRQQRVSLLTELFAPEIGKIDPNFFIRRQESALFEEDSKCGVKIFAGSGITDKEYHEKYPTIHHLILELMLSKEPHDIRLVYLACGWLVAHRGHFLFDVSAEQVEKLLDFDLVYQEFMEYFREQQFDFPWSVEIGSDKILEILQMEAGVRKKEDAFKSEVYDGKKISKVPTEEFPFNREGMIKLLSGGAIKPSSIYGNDAYAELESVSLSMDDEEFVRIISELGEEGEMLHLLRKMKDCAQLISAMHGSAVVKNSGSEKQEEELEQRKYFISAGKVAIYEQHRKDLKWLKYFVKSYCPEKYNQIFRDAVSNNYVFYSGNVKSCPEHGAVKKAANKEAFCDFLKTQIKDVIVKEEDQSAYDDMMLRLELRTFLPKQRDSDNRVIPQQLYRYELARILSNAKNYLPFLMEKDSGETTENKILAIFDFKIPYYVGPLKENGGENTWLKRKREGRILPWNFKDMVDLDESEKRFIQRMTNYCTYLPGEKVLPVHSLLYSRYMVLNELNNLKINGIKISPELKQDIFTEVYQNYSRVTLKRIRDYLIQHGKMEKQDTLTGLDTEVKASLKSYHIFKRLLNSGILTEQDAENIIEHAAYSEDKPRMRRWLKNEYPNLKAEGKDSDVEYLLRQNFKEFGRLSRRFLTEIYGTERDSDGEAFSIMEALWNTNENLMQLLSERYTYSEQIEKISQEYYSKSKKTLDERLDDMYISNSVKRPIIRALDIVKDVVKATGKAPEKIFVEMARGGTPDQKGKRTKSRKQQLIELYKQIKTQDVRSLAVELKNKDDKMLDNRLQSDRLFLYYLQMGKCAYTGKEIKLEHLLDGTYNIEHIYPQCHVKDDIVLNNLVLVESKANGSKSDTYPVPKEIRERMYGFWKNLKENNLMTEEKYRRLTRNTPFTAEERQGFINRQLVETRQSTKAVAALLKEFYPKTEIVYVKASMVSEFRQEFQLVKSRAVNDLHHAKDAYLNIVVGNVYHERFTKRWFRPDSDYNVQVKKIFGREQKHGDVIYWHGEPDIARIKKIVSKNAIHLTRYAFCRKGGLFDQMPVKKAPGLIPLKKGLPTEKYGGYNKPTASFFALVRLEIKGKREMMLIPVNLLDAKHFLENAEYALCYTSETIKQITGKKPENVEILMQGRPLKVNTVFSLDGALVTLAGKTSGGKYVMVSRMMPLKLGQNWEDYIKHLERYNEKQKQNAKICLDEKHDGISREKNQALYELLAKKMGEWPFNKFPNNQSELLKKGSEKFDRLETERQVSCLLNILQLFGKGAAGADLSPVGGVPKSGVTQLSSRMSNWKKSYQDVRIINMSASGLFENRSENLLDML